MKGMQLTAEEKQLLVESLLFTASCDVCAEHTRAQQELMVSLAKRLNNPDQKLYNVYVLEGEHWDDKITESIIKDFANLPHQTIITD